VPPEQEHRDAAAYQFVAALGGAMAAADYPVTMVGETMAPASRAYALENQILALPNYVQVGSPTGGGLYIANPDFDLRYDQSFPLAKLVAQAPSGTTRPDEGMTELKRIRNQQRRFPVWVTILGYAVQSTGLALMLQPTVDSLRALAARLATFLPGAAITLSLIELSTRHVGSGGSRLVAGFMQIAQLAFGILIAAQVAGIADTNLVTTEINRLGAWTPLLGVLVYASGFGGGLTLIMFAVAISHRRVRHHADLDRRRRADRAAAMAGCDPAHVSPNRRAMHD
jgi:uncharacterized membrane protein YjjP (DUF1212 family)